MNMPRKHYDWKLKRRTLQVGEHTLIAGCLDLSASEDPDRAFVRVFQMADQGAAYIEISAELMEPGAPRVSEAEELRRLVPVLKRLKGKLELPIAVLTYKAAVAEKAIEHGAEILHDPTGLTLEPGLAKVANQADCGLILSHMRGLPETWAKMPPIKDAIDTITQELSAAVSRATRDGVVRKRIVVDPGLGFGKRKEQNVEILARLSRLERLELPVHVAPTGRLYLPPVMDPLTPSLATGAITAAILGGAHIVRVHDVASARTAAALADEILSVRPVADTAGSSASPSAPRRSASPPPRR
jgi:dihydropteroate synthase